MRTPTCTREPGTRLTSTTGLSTATTTRALAGPDAGGGPLDG